MSSYVIFFFSSRRRHTRFDCDWSSDVCSSDLNGGVKALTAIRGVTLITVGGPGIVGLPDVLARSFAATAALRTRSEERRVGKECRSRWSPYHLKKKKVS